MPAPAPLATFPVLALRSGLDEWAGAMGTQPGTAVAASPPTHTCTFELPCAGKAVEHHWYHTNVQQRLFAHLCLAKTQLYDHLHNELAKRRRPIPTSSHVNPKGCISAPAPDTCTWLIPTACCVNCLSCNRLQPISMSCACVVRMCSAHHTPDHPQRPAQSSSHTLWCMWRDTRVSVAAAGAGAGA